MNASHTLPTLTAGVICLCVWLVAPRTTQAHCDTMDGPVVTQARAALEKGDVTPVLKWVKKDQEGEIRDAFKQALAVRGKGAEAKELADRYFFETLVRIHRAGEGAPYTGLKPAGTEIEPAVAAADKALEKGSADSVAKEVADAVADGIKQRFVRALEAKKHAEHNVEAGRAYVTAYVEYVHFVERLHADATSHAAHGAPPTSKAAGEQHPH